MRSPRQLAMSIPAGILASIVLLASVAGCTGRAPEPPADGRSAQLAPGRGAEVSDGGVTVRIAADQADGAGTLRLSRSAAAVPDLDLVAETTDLVTVSLDGDASLRRAEVSFPVPADWPAGLVPVVIWEDGAGGWRWLPTTVRTAGTQRSAVAQTDHFSSGLLAGVDPAKLAGDLGNAIKNFFLGRAGVPDPACAEQDEAKRSVRVTSDSGDAVKWCAGRAAGRTVVTIANNRRTYTQLSVPRGWRVTGHGWGISVDQLVRWAGERVSEFSAGLPKDQQILLLDPGETVTIELPAGADGRVIATGSGLGYLLQILSEAVGMYLTVAKAAKLTSTYQAGALEALLGSGTGSRAEWASAALNCLNKFSASFTDDLTRTPTTPDTLRKVFDFAGTCAIELGRASIEDSGPLAWLVSATAGTVAAVVGTAYGLANALVVGIREVVDVALWPFGKQRPTYRIAVRPVERIENTAPVGSLSLGQTATLEHFAVTVSRLWRTSGQGLLVRARVCVRRLPDDPQGDATRISWDPWRVQADGETARARLFDGSHPPVDMFDPDDLYRVGECASGWIPFASLGGADRISEIRYRNGLGEAASWNPGRGESVAAARCATAAFARDLGVPAKGLVHAHCARGWALIHYPEVPGDTSRIVRAVDGRWTVVTGLPSARCYDDLAELDPPEVFRSMLPC